MGSRGGQAFPVTEEWKSAVRRELRLKKLDQKALARAIHCSQAMISMLLNEKTQHSALVPDVHRVLGWAAPRADVPSGDVGELLRIWDALPEVDRARVLERARTLLELAKVKR